jgi:hypothetical protein
MGPPRLETPPSPINKLSSTAVVAMRESFFPPPMPPNFIPGLCASMFLEVVTGGYEILFMVGVKNVTRSTSQGIPMKKKRYLESISTLNDEQEKKSFTT